VQHAINIILAIYLADFPFAEWHPLSVGTAGLTHEQIWP
jgi:hypothetical protein